MAKKYPPIFVNIWYVDGDLKEWNYVCPEWKLDDTIGRLNDYDCIVIDVSEPYTTEESLAYV